MLLWTHCLTASSTAAQALFHLREMDAAPPEQYPPSPSVFLDLPPTPPPPPPAAPHHDGDFDDMALPYIARLLMEEDDNSFFYQYPDHPAVLQAQMPFAQILADCTTTSSGSGSAASDSSSSSPSWSCSADTDSDRSPTLASPPPTADAAADMVTSAFLRGMEEATKFLPTTNNNALLPLNRRRAAAGEDDPDARRATKLMLLPDDDADEASQMFDEMMLDDRDICMKGLGVQHRSPAISPDTTKQKTPNRRGRRRSSNSTSDPEQAVDLHDLLLRCAQAVATDDRGTAQDLLAQIRRHASPAGAAAQRLAHCFAEGLEARLAGTGSRLYRSLMVRRTSAVDFLKAYQLFTAACCCKKVAFAFSNKTIHDAVAGRRRLHIVDYGLGYGFQWPGLLRGLAAREGGPPEVRITGIDLPQPGFRPAHQIEETGRRLSRCAREFGVPFRFRGIAAKRETVSPEDLLDTDAAEEEEEEVLVVSSLCHFRHLMDESIVLRRASPRDEVLGNIRRMRPDVFIHGVMNGGYGTTYFPTRFREALFHYSAQFDLLDATVPRDSQERMLIERDIFGRAALNVIACEGADRVERPETYKQWQARNTRAGLRQLPLKPEVVKVVLDKVRDNYHHDFVVDEDQGWLVHRWKGRVLYGLSTWVSCR